MTTEPDAAPAPQARDAQADARAKLEILERHVDHLMSQLYHQIELIRFHKERGDHLAVQLSKLEHCPKELDEAARRLASFREQIAGLKETDLDLRRRIETLEGEEKKKLAHIERLTKELDRVWNSPMHRFWRLLKRPFVWLTGHSQEVKRSDDGGS